MLLYWLDNLWKNERIDDDDDDDDHDHHHGEVIVGCDDEGVVLSSIVGRAVGKGLK
jgi:hypothetical protein